MRIQASLLAAALSTLASSIGCMHVTTELPGVLDLRSDGADAPAATDALAKGDAVNRDGFGWFWNGGGATGTADVSIEDRQHFVLGLLPVFNDGGKDEWRAAVGDGALRNTVVGEQLSCGAFAVVAALTAVAPCTLGISTCVNNAWDVTGKGTRVLVTASTSAPRDESIPPPQPADGSAPGGAAY